MPRQLDIAHRRQAIATATLSILARGGSRALTIKSIAAELGGSTSLVTHIYPRKSDLFQGVLDWMRDDLVEDLRELGAEATSAASLQRFVEWCLPLDPASLEMEKLRLALLDRADEDPRIRHFLNDLEATMRELFRKNLEPFVASDRVESATVYLRAMTNGAVLSALENPKKWDRHRQLVVLDTIVSSLLREGSDQTR